jgi:putative spermidine/putrescine transport system ATP-binding protein
VRAAAREAAALTLRGLSKRFDEHLAVDDMNLHVEPGELIVLLGPSGCGKTTTLRMIAGFVNASSGDILLDGDSILDLPAYRRDMGVVFQSYALFPHMTVARNVRFGLEVRRMPEPAAAGRVAEMLRLVKLEDFADRLPRSLSGGQQQRVALARALAIHPRLLLLDEPCRTSTRRCARTWRARSASCSATAASPPSS